MITEKIKERVLLHIPLCPLCSLGFVYEVLPIRHSIYELVYLEYASKRLIRV